MVVRNFLYESAIFQRIDALDSLGIPGIPYRGGFAGEVAADLQEAATQDSFFMLQQLWSPGRMKDVWPVLRSRSRSSSYKRICKKPWWTWHKQLQQTRRHNIYGRTTCTGRPVKRSGKHLILIFPTFTLSSTLWKNLLL